MTRPWVIAGVLAFVLVTCVLFPFVLGIPKQLLFDADAGDYSRGAVHLLREGMYSLDGIHPTFEREPGESVLLAVAYALFGVERPVGIYLVQGFLFLAASLFFSFRIARIVGSRAAGFSLILLLTSGSVLHAVFSAYRESLALSLLLLFTGLYVWSGEEPRVWKSACMGLLLSCLILTYYPFLFLPLFLAVLWLVEKRRIAHLCVLLLLTVLPVSLWVLRNGNSGGTYAIIEGRRAGIAWYVRGEQTEKVTGLEPLKCLWSEYISRDWTGRSAACSFNAVWHARWPEGQNNARAADIAAAGRQGQEKILRNVPSYLWFSLSEVIEIHIPFVGGGWSHAFNLYASFTGALLYAGCVVGIFLLRRRHLILVVLFGYTVAVFALTDATPRYLVPVLFCYSVIAGLGYDRLLRVLHFR